MSLKRKFITSLVMCLFAFVSLCTSTFAWFSMNGTATVSGMTVEVSQTGDLIIGTKTEGYTIAPTIESLRASKTNTVDLSGVYSVVKIKPVNHKTIELISDAASVENWFYKIADTEKSYESTTDEIVLEEFAGYVLIYDLYFTVAEGSADMIDLKVKSCTLSEVNTGETIMKAARILVVSDESYEEFDSTKTEGENVLVSELNEAATEPSHIQIYVYIDGEDDSIFTNNSLNLHKTSISLVFEASDKDNE